MLRFFLHQVHRLLALSLFFFFFVLSVQKKLCHCYHTSWNINPFLLHGKCSRWHSTITAVNFKAVPLRWSFSLLVFGISEGFFLRCNKWTDVLFQIVMNQMLERSTKRVFSMGNQRGVVESVQQSAATSKTQNKHTHDGPVGGFSHEKNPSWESPFLEYKWL